jgi:hypothetical protein
MYSPGSGGTEADVLGAALALLMALPTLAVLLALLEGDGGWPLAAVLGSAEGVTGTSLAVGAAELLALPDPMVAVVAELLGAGGVELALGGVGVDGVLVGAALVATGALEAAPALEALGTPSVSPSLLVSAEQLVSASAARREVLTAENAAVRRLILDSMTMPQRLGAFSTLN